jgi:hypothetical protein
MNAIFVDVLARLLQVRSALGKYSTVLHMQRYPSACILPAAGA